MYINRAIEQTVKKMMKNSPSILICGPRQSGKSTLLDHLTIKNAQYVTLDNPIDRKLAIDDPMGFIESHTVPLIIDEFQYAPQLLSAIKIKIDQYAKTHRANKCLYFLTGSQQFEMMKGITESLSGRISIVDLYPLSLSELGNRSSNTFVPKLNWMRQINDKNFRYKNINQIFNHIHRGGMPKIWSKNLEPKKYFDDYVRTYLERDIASLAQVGDANVFFTFLQYIAARTSQEVDYDNISRAIGKSAPTIKNWISILERSGIVKLIQTYSNNISKRIIRRPKLYFMDTGLCAWLCMWPTSQTLLHSSMDGPFFETFVVSEIIKSFANKGERISLYYYRDKDQNEIDLLYVDGDTIYPIEIKKAFHPKIDINFRQILAKYRKNIADMVIICSCDKLTPIKRDTWLFPVSWI